MGDTSDQGTKVKQTLELLEGMQKIRLVPTDVKVTDEGVSITGISKWEDPIDRLRDGAS